MLSEVWFADGWVCLFSCASWLVDVFGHVSRRAPLSTRALLRARERDKQRETRTTASGRFAFTRIAPSRSKCLENDFGSGVAILDVTTRSRSTRANPRDTHLATNNYPSRSHASLNGLYVLSTWASDCQSEVLFLKFFWPSSACRAVAASAPRAPQFKSDKRHVSRWVCQDHLLDEVRIFVRIFGRWIFAGLFCEIVIHGWRHFFSLLVRKCFGSLFTFGLFWFGLFVYFFKMKFAEFISKFATLFRCIVELNCIKIEIIFTYYLIER